MKQQDKELLLQDLCARLPYGFTVHRYSDNCDITIDDIDDFAHFLEYTEGESFKPYLRPMSSMTDEEDKYFAMLQVESAKSGFLYAANAANLIKFLVSHHLDYRGLIEKGLALKAKDGMYKC